MTENIPTDSKDTQVTPEIKDAVQPDSQPTTEPVDANPVDDRDAEIEELRRKNERYLQQIKGREKEADELRAKLIAQSYKQPTKVEPVEEEDFVVPQPIKSKEPNISDYSNDLLVYNTIETHKNRMDRDYRNDEILPYTSEVERQIQTTLYAKDPSGQLLLNKANWENEYAKLSREAARTFADRKASDAARSAEQKVKREAEEIKAREVSKLAPVTKSTAPEVAKVDTFAEDLKSMPFDQLVKKYPDLYARANGMAYQN